MARKVIRLTQRVTSPNPRITRRTSESQLIQLTQDEYSKLLEKTRILEHQLLNQNQLFAAITTDRRRTQDDGPFRTTSDVTSNVEVGVIISQDGEIIPMTELAVSFSNQVTPNESSMEAKDEVLVDVDEEEEEEEDDTLLLSSQASNETASDTASCTGVDMPDNGHGINDLVTFCIGQSLKLLAREISLVAQTYAQTLDWNDDISDEVRIKFRGWSPYTQEYIQCHQRVTFVFEAWIWHILVDALFSKVNFYKKNMKFRRAYQVLREKVFSDIRSKELFSYRTWNKLVLRACKYRALLTSQANRTSKLLMAELGDYVDLRRGTDLSAIQAGAPASVNNAAQQWRAAIEGLAMRAAVLQTLMQLDVAEWDFAFGDPKTGMVWGFGIDEGRMVRVDFGREEEWKGAEEPDESLEEIVELVVAPLVCVREKLGEVADLLAMRVSVGDHFWPEDEKNEEGEEQRQVSGEDVGREHQESARGVKRKRGDGDDEDHMDEKGGSSTSDGGNESERTSSRRRVGFS